jgi:citrate lyase subunit beta/citryl-CoA lyase
MKLRTPLFAPADQDRKARKAIASDADCVILDLEDSVAEAAKDAARDAAAALVREMAPGTLIVRVNPRGTRWHLADLAAVVPAGPAMLMIPKCAGADDLAALGHQLDALETAAGLPLGGIGLLPIVTETAAASLTLASYAAAGPRLRAICFGAEDFSADLGIDPRGPDGAYAAPVAHVRAAVLAAAAAAGVPALDTPWPDPRDPAGLAREAATAAADGFAGKLVIHPDQIGPVRAAFTPSAARLAWARAVLDGFAARPSAGVFALDGKMIDRPHLRLAERILAAAG